MSQDWFPACGADGQPLWFNFHPLSTLQSLAYLLKKCQGAMPKKKLGNAIYLAERQRTLEVHPGLTGDRIMMGEQGPFLWRTATSLETDPIWRRYLRVESDQVKLISNPGNGRLSRSICNSLNQILKQEIPDSLLHLPECQNQKIGCLIHPEHWLKSLGKTPEQIRWIYEDEVGVSLTMDTLAIPETEPDRYDFCDEEEGGEESL